MMELGSKILHFFNTINISRSSLTRPPYKHIVQIGDPILRLKCRLVEKEEIQGPEMKKLLHQMKKTIKRYKCVGVSAPQVGVDVRVFAMEFPKLKDFPGSLEEFLVKDMKPHPYSVWINPTIKVLDYRKVVFPEGCESMRGFHADVPRYKSIQLSGMDENGIEKTEELSGWLARIAQHEMDHLQGKLYLDLADISSLACSFWDRVNRTGGRIYTSYYPNKLFSKG